MWRLHSSPSSGSAWELGVGSWKLFRASESNAQPQPKHPLVNSLAPGPRRRGDLGVATQIPDRSVGIELEVRHVRTGIVEVRGVGRVQRFGAELNLRVLAE